MDDDMMVINRPNWWRRSERSITVAASDASWRACWAHDAAAAAAAAAAEQEKVMQATAQSTLLELLSNPVVQPASIEHFLVAFPVPDAEGMPHRQRLLLAKQCWEHLLDNIDVDRMESMYGKMELLRRIQLHCPTDVFRQHCGLEQMQLLVDAMGSQVKAGTFLCHLRRSLSVDGQHTYRHTSRKVQQLQNKLEGADLLMVAHTLAGAGNVLSIDVQQRHQLRVVHLARHGPGTELESVLFDGTSRQVGSSGSSPVRELVNSLHNGFPLLFQPLIECHVGWLDRLGILLRAGVDAAAVYAPWSCSALHMLFYRKSAGSHKVSEGAQVQAIQLLLQHGAKPVLNLADKGTFVAEEANDTASCNAPTQRTALLQAASAGRFQACRALLAAGADADVVDSCNQSMLDYLFYLKHSNTGAHRRATAGYTCMQLYGLVNEFHLHALVTAELEQDCRSCGRCRFLLGSCLPRYQEETESPPASATDDSDESQDTYHTDHDIDGDKQDDPPTSNHPAPPPQQPFHAATAVIVIDD